MIEEVPVSHVHLRVIPGQPGNNMPLLDLDIRPLPNNALEVANLLSQVPGSSLALSLEADARHSPDLRSRHNTPATLVGGRAFTNTRPLDESFIRAPSTHSQVAVQPLGFGDTLTWSVMIARCSRYTSVGDRLREVMSILSAQELSSTLDSSKGRNTLAVITIGRQIKSWNHIAMKRLHGADLTSALSNHIDIPTMQRVAHFGLAVNAFADQAHQVAIRILASQRHRVLVASFGEAFADMVEEEKRSPLHACDGEDGGVARRRWWFAMEHRLASTEEGSTEHDMLLAMRDHLARNHSDVLPPSSGAALMDRFTVAMS